MRALALTLALVACYPAPAPELAAPACRTECGVVLPWESPDRCWLDSVGEANTLIALERTGPKWPSVETCELMAGWALDLAPALVVEGEPVAGATWPEDRRMATAAKSWGLGAGPHEYAHALRWMRTGDADGEHRDSALWAAVSEAEAANRW